MRKWLLTDLQTQITINAYFEMQKVIHKHISHGRSVQRVKRQSPVAQPSVYDTSHVKLEKVIVISEEMVAHNLAMKEKLN